MHGPTSLLYHVAALLFLGFLVAAEVAFTVPAAGALVQIPSIEVQWRDSGKPPLISSLTTYTLNLMVGGNDQDDMKLLAPVVSGGLYSNGNAATAVVNSGIAEAIENGFFFQIISTTRQGEQVINYSDRFSLLGLTGSVPPKYLSAATALNGSTAGPGNDGSSSSASHTPTQTSSHGDSKTVTVTPTTSSTRTNEATNSPASSGDSGTRGPAASAGGGLSIGAEVAVGMASGVAVVAMVAGVLFVLRRRRRKQAAMSEQNDPLSKPELPADFGGRKRNTRIGFTSLGSEIEFAEVDDGATPSELDSERPPEMDSTTVRYELEGDLPRIAEAGSGRRSVA